MRLPPVPEPPRPAARAPFPIIAVLAPMLGAVIIGLVLSSPFMLLFAALGPIVAVAGVLDARRSARRHRRLEAERFERECALFEQAIDEAHREERHAADLRAPRQARALRDGTAGGTSGRSAGGSAGVAMRIGTGPASSSIVADSERRLGDSDADRRLGRMLARARVNPDLPALVAHGPVVVEGRGLAADVIARALMQTGGVVVHRRDHDSDSVADAPALVDATTIAVLSATALEVREPGGLVRRVRPEFVSALELDAARAAKGSTDALPETVAWADLDAATESTSRDDSMAIGLSASGAVAIDLIRSGPHVLVGGTTGSGKSELLRAMALSWAASSPPAEAQLLFVDFKGGATFAGLTDLPHAIGLVTDLDPVVAHRAVRALRAELRHRERSLTDAGVRDLRESPQLLPRLLVLVDEFATLVETFPELHGVFSDVAARGRSLGVHLVLCTQHPASVVRDTIAANCPVRLSFRVTDAASGGFVGDRARELVAAPPGRAVLVDENGSRLLQVAVVDERDIAHVLERWRDHPAAGSTWSAPLPDQVSALDVQSLDDQSLDSGVEASMVRSDRRGLQSITFGALDDPDERRRRPAVWRPPRDGALAVLGGSQSGRTTTLATLASSVPADTRIVVLPTTVPEAWHVLERLAAAPPSTALLMCDGLDVLVSRSGDRATEVLARWDAAVRALRARGGAVAATMTAASAAGSMLAGRFESRVILRCSDADEHALCGAPRGLFDRSAPAGRGWWLGLQLQVAIGEHPLPAAEPAEAPPWQPGVDADAIVITTRVTEVAERVSASASPHRVVLDLRELDAAWLDTGSAVAVSPRMLIAAPAEWQSAWSVLAAARARVPIVLHAVDPSDVRALLGHRDALPPIDAEQEECWLAEPGRPITRVSWRTVADETGTPSIEW